MLDPQRLLGSILGGSMGGSFGGRQRRGKGAGGLLGGLSPTTKAQIGIGLLGVAWAAWDHYSKKGAAAGAPSGAAMGTPMPVPPPVPMATPSPPPPPPSAMQPPAPPPATPATGSEALDPRQQDMLLLVQAMIAAAAADGLIDDAERATILARAQDAGLDTETTDFLRAELDEPKSLAAIVRATRPEIAADVYAASCLAITLDTDAERAWLDTLATRLSLAPDQREAIHRQLGFA
jgi:uncharacterized membrane protein YebE (DUF533 family)